MTACSNRPAHRLPLPAWRATRPRCWLMVAQRLVGGLLRQGWRWPGMALWLTALVGLTTPGLAHGQSTLLLQNSFTVISRTVLNNEVSEVSGRLTLQNLSDRTVAGPVTLVLENLNPNFVLVEATAKISEGRWYINLPRSTRFTPREPVNLSLSFRMPRAMASTATISFTTRLTQIRPSTQPSAAILLGPDLNGDGIRDDLEPVIQARYRDQPKMLAAAKQQLRAMQTGLVSTQSKAAAFDAVLTLNRALQCIFLINGFEKGAVEIEFLRDSTLNTKERVLAWIAADDLLAGQIIPSSAPNPCEK